MKHKERFAFVMLHQLVVKLFLLPIFERFRLALGQTCTHWKIGFRQIKGCVIILGHCLISPVICLLIIRQKRRSYLRI